MKLLRTFLSLSVVWIIGAPGLSLAQQAFVFYPGNIQGGATSGGAEGASEIVGYLHETTVPFDPRTGGATGAAQHTPIHFTKFLDSASPQLVQASMRGERLEWLRFEFWTVRDDGALEVYYTISVEDVLLTRVSTFLANPDELDEFAMPDTPVLGNVALETISATYGRIMWQHEDGYEYADEWRETTSGKTDVNRRSSDISASVFPNPFNITATLAIDLASTPPDGRVEVSIFDALGRRVKDLVLESGVGSRRFVWDATDESGRPVPSGLYFYRVRAGDAQASGGMTLVK